MHRVGLSAVCSYGGVSLQKRTAEPTFSALTEKQVRNAKVVYYTGREIFLEIHPRPGLDHIEPIGDWKNCVVLTNGGEWLLKDLSLQPTPGKEYQIRYSQY